MRKKRIVITGVGIIAPNGTGKEEYWQALKNGKSGIKPITRFDTDEFKCKLGGEIDNFNPAHFLSGKGLKDLDRTARLLCSAAKWNVSEFEKGAINDGPLFTNVALFPGTVINAASSQVSIRFNIQGFNTTISTGYSSSIDAMKYAIYFIRLGRIKAVLVGGVESFSLANFIGFYKLNFLAGIKGEELSCPFDKRRNGIILSEGAGVLVVEDEEYAEKRKANIYAEVKDIGNCFDSYKIGKYNPEVTGLKESIKLAIKNSELDIKDIDYISASANSVPIQDRLETKAIKNVFGKFAYNIPVSSIKSMIGEPYSAGGLFQIAAAIGSMSYGFIPPTINYKLKDKDCDLDYVENKSRITRVNNVLINNFGPGGNNAALIISKYM
ncbi:beta-ketoacyl-[acyl-carrier-protein] synthase family protein [Candidatus Desantisbacteria bacterium]|nr:beta-ketoacyl-[acyl-carrier-protein] synthase family protein [Candidatus Desantisbacteria bacterium]